MGNEVEPGARETVFGHAICHCSEDDGVPDVGLSIGLGNDQALWIGELLNRDGAYLGFVVHKDDNRIVAPIDDLDAIIDLFRHHVAPALSAFARHRQAAVPEGFVLVPRVPTEAMLEAGEDEVYGSAEEGLARIHTAVWSAMLDAAPSPDVSDGEGYSNPRSSPRSPH